LQDPDSVEGLRAPVSSGGRAAGREMPRGSDIFDLAAKIKREGENKYLEFGKSKNIYFTPAKAFCAGHVGCQKAE